MGNLCCAVGFIFLTRTFKLGEANSHQLTTNLEELGVANFHEFNLCLIVYCCLIITKTINIVLKSHRDTEEQSFLFQRLWHFVLRRRSTQSRAAYILVQSPEGRLCGLPLSAWQICLSALCASVGNQS